MIESISLTPSEDPNNNHLIVTIKKSPLISVDIVVDPRDMKAVATYPDDSIGNQEIERHVVMIDKYVDRKTGEPVNS